MHAAPVLEAPKLEAPVLVAPVLVALVLAAPVLPVPVLEAPVLHNFKGIYAVLWRIWKCRKSRVFGANFLAEKIGWCFISPQSERSERRGRSIFLPIVSEWVSNWLL